MLMDEPFGAIDPINRERLQNEFLRLQAELRKTIVFVTHDIDEAIKMGDKIAILKEGGHLAQFAAPAELLMNPAEQFVEDFVGADRALKRLALQRVRDIDLWKPAVVRGGDPVAEARAKLEDADLNIPLLVDDQNHPLGWLSERGLQGERVTDDLRSPAEPIVELDDILRDALSDLLGSDSQYGAGGRRRRRRRGRALDGGARPRAQPPRRAPADAVRAGRPRDRGRVLTRHRHLAADARADHLRRSQERRQRSARATTASAPAGSSTTSTSTGTRCGSTCCSAWCRS